MSLGRKKLINISLLLNLYLCVISVWFFQKLYYYSANVRIYHSNYAGMTKILYGNEILYLLVVDFCQLL